MARLLPWKEWLPPCSLGSDEARKGGEEMDSLAKLSRGRAAQTPQFPNLQASSHLVQFYLTDVFLLDTVARFIGDGLREGAPAVAVLTESHRKGLDQRLALRGIDVAALLSKGLYVPLDAAETLSKFTVGGWPSELGFNTVIGDLIGRLAAQGQGPLVRVVGEMVALLWNEGNARGALRLEDLWNNLANKIPFTLLCAYPLKTFSRETCGELLGLCAAHSELVAGENETADFHKEIAGTVGSIKRSLADIKTKLAALNLQKSPEQ